MHEESRRPRRAMDVHVDAEPSSPPVRDEAPTRGPGGARHAIAADDTRSKPHANITLIAGILALLLALLVGGVFLTFGTDDDAPQPREPSPTPTHSPTPTKPSGKREVVDDATVTLPETWKLYHDEKTEGDRRLIRAEDAKGEVRLQLTTLTTVDADLAAACNLLVEDQSKEYAVDFEIRPRATTPDGDAHAVVCGFVGRKQDQQEATSVRFTLIQRASDTHTLVLRIMQPHQLAADAAGVHEASLMSCEASRSFGHSLPLC